MKETIISKEAALSVVKYYWEVYRRHPLLTIISLIVPPIGNIFIFFVPPLIVAKIIDIFVAQGTISLGAVSNYIILFGILWLLGEMLWRLGMQTLVYLSAYGKTELSHLSLKLLAEREYDFYTTNFVGSLTKKSLGFAQNFERLTDTLCFNVLSDLIPTIFAVIVLWRYSPVIPLILIASIIITILIAIPFIRYRARLVALRHDAGSRVSGALSDIISNMFAVKSFAKEATERKNFDVYVADYVTKYIHAFSFHNLRFNMTISPIYVATNVIGLILAITFANRLNLEAGSIVVVFSYFSQVTRVFWSINSVYRNIESQITESAEFTQLFLDPPTIQDVSRAKKLKIKEAKITFNAVGFNYHGTQNKNQDLFLEDFNLEIKGNQRIGLVGPSGSGKTTITKLLLRFVDPQHGSISIDEQDIRKVTQRSLREAIAYVPQEPLLFHRTLAENIAYGNPNVSMAELKKAARLAHADDFITTLPDGYNTLVGERGVKLSGGQRQRVAIARALLKKSSILVLDEATSSLDSESEKYIQEGLWELMQNKTAVVIAHRLSTIRHLDRIIVLSEGRVVQDGTHDELITQKGLYATLWSHQSGELLADR